MTSSLPLPRTTPVGAVLGGRIGPRPVGVPIFEALAVRWAADGRLVPGTDDREWTFLVRLPQWPNR